MLGAYQLLLLAPQVNVQRLEGGCHSLLLRPEQRVSDVFQVPPLEVEVVTTQNWPYCFTSTLRLGIER